MNLQPVPIVVNEAQLSEPIHEKTDPRPGCAYHLCESLLTNLGDYRFGRAFLAEVSKQEQKPCWSLFAGIEELVNQCLLGSDVPCQQIRPEPIGKRCVPLRP